MAGNQPDVSTGGQSGVVSGTPQASQGGYGGLPTNAPNNPGAMPDWARLNTMAFNPGGSGSLESSMFNAQGLQNYNNLYNQYGQGQQNWTPWAFQNASAGGAGDMYNTQNTNLLLGNGYQSQLMAGHQYNNTGYRDVMRNAYSGDVSGYGAGHNMGFDASSYWHDPSLSMGATHGNAMATHDALLKGIGGMYGQGAGRFDVNQADPEAYLQQNYMNMRPDLNSRSVQQGMDFQNWAEMAGHPGGGFYMTPEQSRAQYDAYRQAKMQGPQAITTNGGGLRR